MNYLKYYGLCVKEASSRDVSFTHTKYLFDRGKMLIIIIFESIYRGYLLFSGEYQLYFIECGEKIIIFYECVARVKMLIFSPHEMKCILYLP